MNIACMLERVRHHYISKPFCLFRDKPTTFDDFSHDAAAHSAELLRLGVLQGHRVALLCSNRPEFLRSLFAIWAIGAIAVPVNPGLAPPEIQKIIDHCEPALVMVEHGLSALLAAADGKCRSYVIGPPGGSRSEAPRPLEITQVRPEETALIYYTSGTTGLPKGAMLSHGAVMATCGMFSRHLGVGPADRSLVTGPMTFILHLTMNALTSIAGGASFVILEKFRPDLAFDAIERHRISVLVAVPTVYTMLANTLGDRSVVLSTVRLSISAGATFPDALAKRISQRLGINVLDVWGMTECGPITCYDPSTDTAGRPDSCGRALPSCEFRIVDDALNELDAGDIGEVVLRCPGLMDGYYRNQQATDEAFADGWMRSGDLGRADAEGYLYIVGRKKDLIIRGGANIYPVDVEEVLYTHPAVAECAVIGVPDVTFGELVKAFVVVRDGAQADCTQLIGYCRDNIAEYKAPSEIEIVESLPKGPTGKILRRQLREILVPERFELVRGRNPSHVQE